MIDEMDYTLNDQDVYKNIHIMQKIIFFIFEGHQNGDIEIEEDSKKEKTELICSKRKTK